MIARCLFGVVATMLVIPSGDAQPNPWRDKVAAAVQRAESEATVEAFAAALDFAWRADDWRAGLKLARQAIEKHRDEKSLLGPAVRAVWRAGLIEDAEALAKKIKPEDADRVGLSVLIQIASANGRHEEAGKLSDRLERLGPQTASEWGAILGPRLQAGRTKDMADTIRKIAAVTRDENGYPDIVFRESLEGLPEFFAAVGDEPLNRVTAFGSAPMPVIPMMGLPGVDAMINGKGPFRFIVDTGGSITLSLDREIAEELEIKSIAKSSVRGVAGKQDAEQALIREMDIGGIRVTRVLTRVWELPAELKASVAGVIGTGMFAQARMTLDFDGGKLIVAESSEKPAAGVEIPLRLIGDAKMVSPVRISGGAAAALLDSGAGTAAVSPAKVQELFPDKKIAEFSAPMMGAGDDGPVSITFSPPIDVEMLGRRYEKLPVMGLVVLDTVLGPYLGMELPLLVGMPQFREMRSLTVDFHRSRMWIDWIAPASTQPGSP